MAASDAYAPLVSVLTPVYNGEPYLRRCIESVLEQTYRAFEYVIIDNCSTDRTPAIVQEYAARDARIRVVRNATLLSALANCNRAVRLMSPASRYCKFVLADDWIFPRCLEEMVAVGEASPTAGIIGAYRLEEADVGCDGLAYPGALVPGKELCRRHLREGLFVFGTPTSVMYRTEVVKARTPFFQESSLHADTEACYEILETWDFGFVHQVLTFTRRENESISSALRDFNPNLLDKYIVVKRYGRKFLDADEYRTCSRVIHRRYFSYLGESALRMRKREFWDYHRRGLGSVGESLNRIRVAWHALLALLDLLLNPKATSQALIRRWRRTRRAVSK
jgi:glycosyltransferase involved in cell wall biosynthesis